MIGGLCPAEPKPQALACQRKLGECLYGILIDGQPLEILKPSLFVKYEFKRVASPERPARQN